MVYSDLYSCGGVYNLVMYSSCCTALNFLLVEERREMYVTSMFVSHAPSCCRVRLPVDLERRETMVRSLTPRPPVKIFFLVSIM